MKKRVYVPIRFKFMFTFLVIVTAVVGLITFSTANLFREDKRAYVNDLTQMVALATAEELESSLTGSRERLQVYAGVIADSGLTAEEKSDLSQRFFRDFPELISVTLERADEEPITVYDRAALEAAELSPDSLKAFETSLTPRASSLEDDRAWVANSTLSAMLPSYTIVFDHEGTSITAWVRSERLLDVASRFSAYDVFVTDSAGSFLIHSDRNAVVSRHRSGDVVPYSADERNTAGVTKEYEREGRKLIGGFAALKTGEMVAGAEIPVSATYLASQRLLQRLLTVAVVLIVLSLALAFFWSLRITRPVEHLVDATRRVAKGEFDVKVRRESSDEIGNLADSFTQMALELMNRENALNEAQEQLIQSEKMAAFGQLGAGVAHEIKNPLAGILASAQIARSEASEGTQVWEDLRVIEKETKRCRTIIDNLLRFARQEKSVKDQTSVNAVVHDSVAIVHHQLELNKVKLHTELNDDLPFVRGNANQLQQVFMNLMINAQQAMEGTPGVIEVTSSLNDDGQVEVRFKDTGPGIAPEVKEKLFEPFFTTKPAGKGTGLGLSVSYGVIEDHEGSIVVESEPGHGATFVITLPTFESGAPTGEATTVEQEPVLA